MRPIKLIVVSHNTAGLEIQAILLDGQHTMAEPVGPWIFAYQPTPPAKWNEILNTTFKEMVDAWNEKYGVK